MIFSPIEIFEINAGFFSMCYVHSSHIISLSISIFFVFLTIFTTIFTISGKNVNKGISHLFWSFFFNFTLDIIKNNLKSLRALKYFPILFLLLLFIFILNFSGLLFFDVSITSHIAMTLYLSISFFILFFVVAIINFDISYFFKFIEKDINLFLKIILFFIEIISFIIRPFSLGIRLFTNMLSGHVLLHIFISFFIYIQKNYVYLLFLPIIIIFLIFALEIFISLIQTYVFVILLTIYIKDMYMLH
jgi:ATP synthase subunit 6